MGSSIKSCIVVAALATAILAASTGANAHTAVDMSVTLPGGPPTVVQMPVQPLYGRERGMAACGAPRWDPRVHYMPGQLVRRHGGLWIAKPLSARMWNENSPPEWTPQLWAAAECMG